jgi:D-3-phosphoglycerate dehydrogenase
MMHICLTSYDDTAVPDWVPARLTEHDCDLKIQQRTASDDVASIAAGSDVVWVFGGGNEITHDVLPRLANCRFILRTGTGTDNVPVNAASQRGIIVANTPEASTDTVAEHTLSLLLAVLRRISALDREARAGRWQLNRTKYPLLTLTGKTLGLVGFGRIARSVMKKASGFDVQVLAHDPWVDDDDIRNAGADPVGLHPLFRDADCISLHCPLLETTHHLVSEPELSLVKPTAVLVNTARGKLIDEAALIAALDAGKMAGAGLDVMETQPPSPDSPLLHMDNVVINPHSAGYDEGLRERFWSDSVRTLIAIKETGKPIWVVNPTP